MNQKILITNSLNYLKKNLNKVDKKTFYFIVEENYKSNLFRNYFLSFPKTCEIASKDIIKEKEFVKNYSRFIYNLNIKNISRIWWAKNFTNKSPIHTPLCKNVYDFLVIKELIKKGPDKNIVAILSDPHLARFIKRWAEQKEISITVKVYFKKTLKSLLSSIPFFFICYSFGKLFLRMVSSKLFLNPVPKSSKKDFIVITQFEKDTFRKDGTFYDVYFGRLREYLRREDMTFMAVGFVACPFKNLLRRKNNEPAYPLEYFLSLADLFKCFRESIISYFARYTINGNTNIDSCNVLELIKNEVDRTYDTGQIFVNLSVYHGVKNLLSRVHTRKLFYPFENRSWEKMILLAAYESQKEIELIGYQHASLTPKHINFILEDKEINSTPFPEKVISMGKITKDLLEEVFSFPKDLVRIGCALRQNKSFSDKKNNKSQTKNCTLLVALASNLDEYARTLKFLDDSSIDKKYIIKIRPHPAINFNEAPRFYRPHNFNYILDRNKKLIDSLQDSDIVLYVSSTVGIEALAIGKPVIYIDFGNFLNSDPLFNFLAFKWKCEAPENLSKIINEIKSLEESAFKERQRKGIIYAKEYFYPVNNENLKPFLYL